MDFIYNSVGATNGIDAYGHFLRSNLQLTSCVEVASTIQSGCEAFFRPTSTPTATKKKKKSKKARKTRAKLRSRLPLPPIDVPDLSQLLPPATSEEPEQPEEPAEEPDSGTTTTTPDPESAEQPTTTTSMRSAKMFLNFLLGGGA
jgi:hypothetical protein